MGLDLTDRDVQAMLRFTARNDDDVTCQSLPIDVLVELRDLVPCDTLSASGQDDYARSIFTDQDVPDDTPSVVVPPDDVYWQHYWNCLPCSYPSLTGDLVSVTMESDFYTARALHHTGMYVDFLRPWGVEHELMLCLPAGPGRTLRLIFFRGKGVGFSERDRALLTLLCPHLHAAYIAAERLRRGRERVTARQFEILQHVALGLSNRRIARQLSVSEATVRKHLENAFAILGVSSRTAAVARAGVYSVTSDFQTEAAEANLLLTKT